MGNQGLGPRELFDTNPNLNLFSRVARLNPAGGDHGLRVAAEAGYTEVRVRPKADAGVWDETGRHARPGAVIRSGIMALKHIRRRAGRRAG